MRHLIKISLLIISLFVFVFSQDYTESAKNFSINGINFDMTYDSIKSKYPNIKYLADISDSSCNNSIYFINTKSTDGVSISFVNDYMHEITIAYDNDRIIDEFGSIEILFKKIVNKIGLADSSNTLNNSNIYELYWNFENIHRKFKTAVKYDNTFIIITDTNVDSLYYSLKEANADPGF